MDWLLIDGLFAECLQWLMARHDDLDSSASTATNQEKILPRLVYYHRHNNHNSLINHKVFISLLFDGFFFASVRIVDFVLILQMLSFASCFLKLWCKLLDLHASAQNELNRGRFMIEISEINELGQVYGIGMESSCLVVDLNRTLSHCEEMNSSEPRNRK